MRLGCELAKYTANNSLALVHEHLRKSADCSWLLIRQTLRCQAKSILNGERKLSSWRHGSKRQRMLGSVPI